MIYECVVSDTRREVARQNREIVNVRNAPEVFAALEAILKPRGLKPAGHTIRVFEPGRRPRLVAEVTA